MPSSTHVEGTLRRDRLIVLAGLVGISALAWAYLIYLTLERPQGAAASLMGFQPQRADNRTCYVPRRLRLEPLLEEKIAGIGPKGV